LRLFDLIFWLLWRLPFVAGALTSPKLFCGLSVGVSATLAPNPKAAMTAADIAPNFIISVLPKVDACHKTTSCTQSRISM